MGKGRTVTPPARAAARAGETTATTEAPAPSPAHDEFRCVPVNFSLPVRYKRRLAELSKDLPGGRSELLRRWIDQHREEAI